MPRENDTIIHCVIHPTHHVAVSFGDFRLNAIDAMAIRPPSGEFVMASFDVVFVIGRGEGAVDFSGGSGYPFLRMLLVTLVYVQVCTMFCPSANEG